MGTEKIKKIVIIGPESTGKSTLCEQLAQHFDTLWCPEFAREYLLIHGTDYDYDDLFNIAKGQLALEEEYIQMTSGKWRMTESETTAIGHQLSNLLFIDTDMYVMKVWCEFVFGKCHKWILEQIVERKYDLYLLCNTDLPWTKDELREYPDLATREKLFRIYKDVMLNQDCPWTLVKGDTDSRLKIAVNAVDTLLRKQ